MDHLNFHKPYPIRIDSNTEKSDLILSILEMQNNSYKLEVLSQLRLTELNAIFNKLLIEYDNHQLNWRNIHLL